MATTYVSLREAADRLGVSVDTIRRRIAAGELEGQREARPQGYRWLVGLPADLVASPPDATHTVSTGTRTLAVVEAENQLLRDSVAMLQDELAVRRREVAELHTLLHQLPAATAHVPVPDWRGFSTTSAAGPDAEPMTPHADVAPLQQQPAEPPQTIQRRRWWWPFATAP